MKLGTSGFKGATRVMLLGSGELGKEVAISLQRYGVEVIAVDRYASAPAQQVAQRSRVVDMTNPEALRALIEEERPDFIVPEIEAIATEVLLDYEESGTAVVIPNARAVRLTMNREGIRRLAAETLNLPTSGYRFAGSAKELEEAAECLGCPCFVKPIMSSSGKGQTMLRSLEDVEEAWHHAQESGRVHGSRVIVEQSIDFDYEITLVTVRSLDASGQLITSFCEPIGHLQKQGDYVESWQPQPMSHTAWSEACRIAGRIVEELGGFGVFGVELFIKGDQVWFSEVSPRPHDTGMVTMVTQRQSEFELHARAMLGLPVSTRLECVGASAVIYAGTEGQGPGYEGLDEALMDSDIEVRLFGKPEAFPKRRMGVALARAESVDLARNKARTAAQKLRISVLS